MEDKEKRLRIAMIATRGETIHNAPLDFVETVVEQLAAALEDRGHDVTTYWCSRSRSGHPVEVDRVADAFDAIDFAAAHGRRFDVIHDHTEEALPLAQRIATPMVHTIHRRFTPELTDLYSRHGDKALLVALSATHAASAPQGLDIAGVVPNPIAVGDWRFRVGKQHHLLSIVRFTEDEGAHHAIEAARRAGMPLHLAGRRWPGHDAYLREQVVPYLDEPDITFVDAPLPHAKRELLAKARALLVPCSWAEPFGRLIVQALACGTPVIAYKHGAATEIVRDGVNGFLVDDEEGMAAAINRLGEIDPEACRREALAYCGVAWAANRYEALYRRAAGRA